MTTANLMNVPSVNGNIVPQTDASKKLQEENLEVAEVFAGLMNQTIDIPDSVVDDTSSNMDVSKTNSTESPTQSYERYSYKDKQIDTVKEPSIEEKLEEAGEVLEEAGEEIIDTLCEEYGVDEETIQNLLDDMGLSALDLLNPQNLVSFLVQLTGVASGEELLLDENFLSVMETLDHMAEGLMRDLNVDQAGLQELISEMDLVTSTEEVPTDFQEVLNNTLNHVENSDDTTTETNATTEAAQVTENVTTVSDEQTADVKAETQKTDVEAESEQTMNTDVDENANDAVEVVEEPQQDTKEETVEVKTEESVETTEKDNNAKTELGNARENLAGQENGENQNSNSLLNHNNGETIVQTQTTSNISQSVQTPQMTQFSSYLSADAMQIMEQVVQQMRVTISNEITTMEMQMNPENLGKVYVNISSEEGVVNAQFHATNEVVKEALEAQVATLRESLNQAGVKVDAIEVTIASHEFERNLEQNHQNPDENVNAKEAHTQKRRNLNLDSLDELSGMMTEEEALVAQIMRDNGNSVDFTA